jgi:hypothetical protein
MAAWAERNFCAEQALLKRCILRSRCEFSARLFFHRPRSCRCSIPRSRAAGPYDRKSSVTNRPERRHTSSVASASNSERRACCAWIGPAHRGPRPRRRQRAIDKPSAHRFSDTFYTFASGGARLEPSRVGRRRACRARQRSQSSGEVIGEWFISVFGSIDLERRAAASSHVDPRSAERGILHSQIVCGA